MRAPLEERLFPGIGPGVRLGLDRVEAALEAFGNPHLRYPALHVGGTNGKGSVATVWASILRARGLRVGLYTSPHLCSIRERFVVDGEPASAEALEEGAARVLPLAREHGLSFFEATTLLAFDLFARAGVDVAVVEVGLGGRLDATRVLHPLVTAVTNVALDHREYLGDTLEEVAREKAGIARRGVPFLTSQGEGPAREVLREGARSAGAPFVLVDPQVDLQGTRWGRDGTAFWLETTPWGRLHLESPFVGPHQAANVALAVRALEYLPREVMPDRASVTEGVRRARHPGRLQLECRQGISWLLDVAHNPAGARALADALEGLDLPHPRVFVVGVLADKDWKGILRGLRAPETDVILTVPPSAPENRRWSLQEAAEELEARDVDADRGASTLAAGGPDLEPDFLAALGRAERRAGPGGTVVVTGSCATVGDALMHLGRPPWPGLAPPGAGSGG